MTFDKTKSINIVRRHYKDNSVDLSESAQRVAEYMIMLKEHLQNKQETKPFPMSFYGDLIDSLVEIIQGLSRAEAGQTIEQQLKRVRELN